MTLSKLNQKGFSHYLIPLLVVIVIGLIGAKVLLSSHADSVNTATCAVADLGNSVVGGVLLKPAIKVTNASTSSLVSDFTVSETIKSGTTTLSSNTSNASLTVPASSSALFNAHTATLSLNQKLIISAVSTSGPSFSCSRTATATSEISPPLTQITINSFTATTSPLNASNCDLNASVSFTPNGSGTVSVVWYNLSSKTHSDIENPDNISFVAPTTKSDTDVDNGSIQGLETGDSYRIYAVLTDTANTSITVTAGPTTITSCASPAALLSPGQKSTMTKGPVSSSLKDAQNQDSVFPNECAMQMTDSYTVSGAGSVQVDYILTSASNIGDTYYSPNQADFSGIGGGGSQDVAYFRMPHLPNGGLYTITAKQNVLGDPSHSTLSSPITSACS